MEGAAGASSWAGRVAWGAAVLVTLCACSEPGLEARAGRVEAVLEESLERHGVPGAAAAVVGEGRVRVVMAGEAGEGRRVTAETVFEAASLSKPVVAYAAMSLAEEGRLDPQRSVRCYLPAEELPLELQGTLPLATLLAHASGLPNRGDEGALTLAFRPGTRWSYSGEGYRLLQRVMERVTGRPLEEIVERRVFAPCGMTSSTFDGLPEGTRAAVGVDGWGERVEVPAGEGAAADAAGSLLTTAGDYARFVARVMEDARAGGPGASMVVPEVVVDEERDLWWGRGWALWRGEERAFFHWGSNPGFESFALGDAARERGVVLLTNGQEGLEMAEEITAAAVGRSHPFFDFYMLHPD